MSASHALPFRDRKAAPTCHGCPGAWNAKSAPWLSPSQRGVTLAVAVMSVSFGVRRGHHVDAEGKVTLAKVELGRRGTEMIN